jgi:hypothetical protein
MHRSTRAPVEPPAPVSAARRAAEAAFAAPSLPSAAPAVPVQIVSVRRRLRELPNQLPPIADVVADPPAEKTPRVFRLRDTQSTVPTVPSLKKQN